MNKNGKIKGKLNVIDLLVVVLIIAVAAGIAVRFGSKITAAVKSDVEFEYVVRVQGVRAYTVDALEKKGILTDKKSSKALGEIISVESEPAIMTSQTSDGKLVEAALPEKYTVFVTVRTTGQESDNSYITGDSAELSVGGTTELYTKYVNTSGSIESIRKISE